MTNESKKMWMVRAGEDGVAFDKFEREEIAAIGWQRIGNLAGLNETEILEKVRKFYPERSERSDTRTTAKLYQFCKLMQKGDWIITYNQKFCQYMVGKIAGDYEYCQQEERFVNVRKVEWRKSKISRDDLEQSTKEYFPTRRDTVSEIKGRYKNDILGRIS